MTRLATLALVVFTAVWLAAGGPSQFRRRLETGRCFGRERLMHIAMAVASVLVGSWIWSTGAGPSRALLVGAAVVSAVVVRRLFRDVRARAERRRRQLAVVEFCDALAAELRAGLSAATALEHACRPWPELSPAVSAARLGTDVTGALRQCAAAPGAESLRVVAAGWEVAGRSGAALAVVLERVAAGLRSDDEARAEVVAALGPPRATAKMLAVLPVFGLGLGMSMGAQPIQFLLHTGVGALCLILGVSLALVGVFWVERLALAAEV